MMNNEQHKPAAAPDVALDKQTAANGKPQPIIGRLMDQISALPVLWGLNEPGALLRNSDVLRVLVAAGREQAALVQVQEPVATVYPPDGTVAPFTVINLGYGLVKMGDSLHDGRLPALWFGTDGLGMGISEEMNRAAKAGETLAVVTFANVEGLDVLSEVVQRIRSVAFPSAPAQPVAVQDDVAKLRRERDTLAQSIADAALKAGIWNGEVPLSGPHLLMMVNDMAECIATPAAQGDANTTTKETCKNCGGEGRFYKTVMSDFGSGEREETVCKVCVGSGVIYSAIAAKAAS